MTRPPRLSGPSPVGAGPIQRIHPAALRVRGRIATAMLALHAISPEGAVDFAPGPRDSRDFEALRAAGIVREAPDGRFWFDLVAYHLRARARSRAAAIWGFGIALTVALAATLFYQR